jgi:hypothetical protein
MIPGQEVYSVERKDHRLELNQSEDGVTLLVKGDTHNGTTATIGITVDADELVRALIAASPDAVNSIGSIAKSMIELVLNKQGS